ncbi:MULTISPECIES: CaiB/BaiF CoA transferase family protein [Amycolatopsis]|uniref:CaiB/BaiF CoA transferase family protein n=1 Tax=Amycolatopsis TaxID=1813 RepID=UPI000B8B6371|nr:MULTISPECIES: CaiB/BaiF CoA-transferase family protein [Amycolatopsis]OXM66381.1 carnitine dehydratase [Amycolatopsis sp. KNN50.9b]
MDSHTTDTDAAESGGRPLTGLRVVALEHAVAAPLCSRHLADLGADVVKVENPAGGDLARGYDSVVRGQSAYFVWANRGKRSVALDLKTEDGRAVLAELLGHADVFVHNLGPGAVDRMGFGAEVLARRWPRLIACAISGYGATGPYRDHKAFDLLIQGEAGLLSVTGTPDQPAKVGISVADMCAGVYAMSAILAALLEREHTGRGRTIDISMLDCLAEWMMAPAYHQLYSGRQPSREGARHNMMVPYGVYRVGDHGHVNFAVQTAAQWRALCDQVLSRPDLTDHPDYRTNELRVRHRDSLEREIEREFAASAGVSDIAARLVAAGIPTGDVNDLAGLLDHPQLRARDRWFDAGSPGGPIRALRPPFDLGDEPGSGRGVPGLGEHTDEVLAEIRRGEHRR